MATQYLCDRCGHVHVTPGSLETISFKQNVQRYEICFRCVKELEKFMSEKKKGQ